MRRDPGESLHRTVADHIRTQTGYLSGKRNVCLVIVAIEGGGVRRSVVKNEHLDHRPGILPIRRADRHMQTAGSLPIQAHSSVARSGNSWITGQIQIAVDQSVEKISNHSVTNRRVGPFRGALTQKHWVFAMLLSARFWKELCGSACRTSGGAHD